VTRVLKSEQGERVRIALPCRQAGKRPPLPPSADNVRQSFSDGATQSAKKTATAGSELIEGGRGKTCVYVRIPPLQQD